MYSHDTYGLGHLRRCLTIAKALTEATPRLWVTILTGSSVADAYSASQNIDLVQLPGICKKPDGSYASTQQSVSFEATIKLRSELIVKTAEALKPQLLITDKEAQGVGGELIPALEYLKQQGSTCVLGLREILDDPETLREEWKKKNTLDVIERFYKEIWIYGPDTFYDTLQGLPANTLLEKQVIYTGFLRRSAPQNPASQANPYMLVTIGGGGDGAPIIDALLDLYIDDDTDLPNCSILTGAFLPEKILEKFIAKAEPLKKIKLLPFSSASEGYLNQAQSIIAMGGYNTFCEILSFNKPALIIPRTTPRLEQFIRTKRTSELGLATTLSFNDIKNPELLRSAILDLQKSPPPSNQLPKDYLEGLGIIRQRVAHYLPLTTKDKP